MNMSSSAGGSLLRKFLLPAAVMALPAAVLVLMVSMNFNTPVLAAREGLIDGIGFVSPARPVMLTGEWKGYRGTLTPPELAENPWSYTKDIQHVRKMSGNTYSFRLAADRSDFVFMLPRPHKSRLWVNGKEVLGDGGSAISSTEYFPLSEYRGDGPVFDFVLQVADHSSYDIYQGVLLGEKSQFRRTWALWIISDQIATGLSLMLILICLSLYLYKRTETYLLLLAVGVCFELFHFLLIPRYPLFILPLGSVGFYAQFSFINYFICRQFLPEIPGKKTDALVLSVFGISLLFSLINLDVSGIILRFSRLIYFAVQIYILIKGLIRGIREAILLLLGCSLAFVNCLFYTFLSVGFIPQGVVDVQILPAQYFNIAYFISFAIATTRKFAMKFDEASQLSVNLESRVLEKTRKLRESREDLLQIQKKRQHFMTDMVHNIRSPLFALSGYIDMLEDKRGEPGAIEKYLTSLRRKTDYLNRFVNDMFLISRLEDGEIQFNFYDFSLADFLKTIILPETRDICMKRSIVVEFSCGGGEIMVYGDPFRLRQALDNIIDNAVRYTADKGVVLIECFQADEIRAGVSVTDYGEGISTEKQAFLFERYKSKGAGGNTGLGLSIADFIVKNHGGTIEVDSTPGRGSRFTVYLQLKS